MQCFGRRVTDRRIRINKTRRKSRDDMASSCWSVKVVGSLAEGLDTGEARLVERVTQTASKSRNQDVGFGA